MQAYIKFLYVSLTVAPIILAYLIRKKTINLIRNSKNDGYSYRNLFFSYRPSCEDHIKRLNHCGFNCSNQFELIQFIRSAKYSISVCVLILQHIKIIDALIEAHGNGIVVRVILDKEMIDYNSPKLNKLRTKGVPVKIDTKEKAEVHHKFCIIDEIDKNSANMFFGSLNFTLQGVVYNYEHVTITNNYEIISMFSEEFNNLWNEFSFYNSNELV